MLAPSFIFTTRAALEAYLAFGSNVIRLLGSSVSFINLTPMTSLSQHPDIAQMVGYVVADYAILENLMLSLYAAFSKMDPAESMAAFYGMRSVQKKEELVSQAAGALPVNYQAALARLWKRFKSAANRRTEIAHCAYFDQGEGLKRMRMIKGKPHYDSLSAKIFEHTFKQFRTLATDILTLSAVVQLGRSEHQLTLGQLPLSPKRKHSTACAEKPSSLIHFETEDAVESLSRLGLL